MKRNVLVIFVDELRADALSLYGNPQCLTPNLDSLALDATVYRNHFCSCPICTPSRFSMLSGLYATEHCVWTNKGTLQTEFDTWPKTLRDNGYDTVAVGKMHSSPTYLDVGFSRMLLCEQDGNGRFEDDYHEYLYEHNQIDLVDIMDQRAEYREQASSEYFDSFGSCMSNLDEPFHSTSWVTDHASQELRRWTGEGNLLFVSFIKPHHPFDPIKRFVDMYDERSIEPLFGYTDEVPTFDYLYDRGYFDNAKLSESALRKMTHYYYAMISQIDDGIGKMVRILKEKRLYDDTMIVFTADHGDYMGFHHMALKQNHMYDPLMRIPLLIKRPRQNQAKTIDAFSDNTQFAHAILSEIGCDSGSRMNRRALDDDQEYLLGMYRHRLPGVEETAYMVRSKRYKLLVDGEIGNYRLFDMQEDPIELHNIGTKQESEKIIRELFIHLLNQICFNHQSMNCHIPGSKTVSKACPAVERQHGKLEEYSAEKFGLKASLR